MGWNLDVMERTKLFYTPENILYDTAEPIRRCFRGKRADLSNPPLAILHPVQLRKKHHTLTSSSFTRKLQVEF